MPEYEALSAEDRRRYVAEVVRDIEHEMRRLLLWTDESPSAEAMTSETPFCYDTLSMAQWLQWLFLPRMKDLLEQNGTLPTSSGIWPLAEEELSGTEQNTAKLLELIRNFDRLITLDP